MSINNHTQRGNGFERYFTVFKSNQHKIHCLQGGMKGWVDGWKNTHIEEGEGEWDRGFMDGKLGITFEM